MNLFKNAYGNILKGTGKVLEFILTLLISIMEIIVSLTVSIGRGILGLMGIGGCLLIFMFFGPLGLFFIFQPRIIIPILFLILVPIIGTRLIFYFKYIKYMTTQFLFDKANYLIDGKKRKFETFSEYGNKYRRMRAEEESRERRKRQEEEQRQWEERFRQWNQQQQQGYSYQGSSGGYQQSYANPTTDFKNKYEKSCDLLGVDYNSSENEIKLAYRKKAKEYHPDINHSPNATEMFQKINEAYEFLGDSNIQRYKSMN